MAGLVTLEAQLPPAGSWEDASSKNHRPWLGGTPPQTPASQHPALICSLGARLVLGQAGACSRVRWSLGGLPRSLEGGGPRSRRGGEPGLAMQAGSPGKAPVKDRPDGGCLPSWEPSACSPGGGRAEPGPGAAGCGGAAPRLGSSLGCGWVGGWGSPLSFLFSPRLGGAAGGGLVLPGREWRGLIPTLCRGPAATCPRLGTPVLPQSRFLGEGLASAWGWGQLRTEGGPGRGGGPSRTPLPRRFCLNTVLNALAGVR